MKRIFFIVCMVVFAIMVDAQPARRRDQQQPLQSNANNITTRARISFPVAQEMPEDVVWRRDIYRCQCRTLLSSGAYWQSGQLVYLYL